MEIIDRQVNLYTCSILTLNPFKLSTTQANNASLPTVTVIFGIGSANLGKFASERKERRKDKLEKFIHTQNRKIVFEKNIHHLLVGFLTPSSSSLASYVYPIVHAERFTYHTVFIYL